MHLKHFYIKEIVEKPDAVFGLQVIPIGVQEMVMALWLNIKGFDTEALVPAIEQ